MVLSPLLRGAGCECGALRGGGEKFRYFCTEWTTGSWAGLGWAGWDELLLPDYSLQSALQFTLTHRRLFNQ